MNHKILIVGFITFIVLYIFASTQYPGGSQNDLSSTGFDWIHNYWCNLMNVDAMNGSTNPARPFAILAWIILCLTMMIFFAQFGGFVTSKIWKIFIQWGGILSMVTAIFMFSSAPYMKYLILVTRLFFGRSKKRNRT